MERRTRHETGFQYLFTLGIVVGVAIGLITTLFQINPFISDELLLSQNTDEDDSYELQKSLQMISENQIQPSSNLPGTLLKRAEEVLARMISAEVKILCLVMTNSTRKAAHHVKLTWGRHCNKLIFISDGNDESLPSADVGKEWHREGSWAKTNGALKYVWRKYREEFDWIIKTNDKNYVFVENLQEMLLPYTPDEPIFFGFRMNPILPQGYMSENAGLVMSKEVVMRLVNNAFDGKDKKCPQWNDNKHPDDIKMGICLAAVNAVAGDSRDWEGRNRFFPMDVATHAFVQPTKYKWFWTYTFWPAFIGMEGCADTPVSFHYIKPAVMYAIEYLAFTVRPFVVNHLEMNTPAPTPASANLNQTTPAVAGK
ncbi:glycoprotein-N-acetylgalactosamine 3-beta-galactosyltransferase 1-like [Neocloeon triangulifer]|uniref:glycoprotein-N-acetylgalactosamine 3-beta-galactosyltransferase 1-like n=1 Tax=Neocloeon triangulifer TaxID=2078957 RepID=UPI00286F26FF|nr:glycoprotein-N-acetylgalactosamine 3-beta-galactosyltransferase 1-like [Neocloeon triangulifer]